MKAHLAELGEVLLDRIVGYLSIACESIDSLNTETQPQCIQLGLDGI